MNSFTPIQSFTPQGNAFLAENAKQAENLKRMEGQMQSAVAAGDNEALWQAAEGFEEIFLNAMLKQMRNTVFESEFSLDSSNASKTYRSMLDEHIAKIGSKNHQFGIAKMVYESMVSKMSNSKAAKTQISSRI